MPWLWDPVPAFHNYLKTLDQLVRGQGHMCQPPEPHTEHLVTISLRLQISQSNPCFRRIRRNYPGQQPLRKDAVFKGQKVRGPVQLSCSLPLGS